MFLVPTRPFPFGWQNGPIFSLPPPYARAVKFSIPPPSLVWLADDAAGTRAECLLTLPQAYTRAHRRVRACRLKDIPGLRGLSQADVCAAAQERDAGIKPRLWSFDSSRTVSLSSLSFLFFFFSKACAAVRQATKHVSAAAGLCGSIGPIRRRRSGYNTSLVRLWLGI